MTKANVNEDGGLGKVLVEQHGDFLRETLKTALRLLMEAEVAGRCGDRIRGTERGAAEPAQRLPLQRSYPYVFLDALYIKVREGTRVVGIFPNAASVPRLVVMILVEQNDESAASRWYFSLQSMELLKPTPVMMLEAVA